MWNRDDAEYYRAMLGFARAINVVMRNEDGVIYGADRAAKDKNGKTPLDSATSYKNTAAIELLK